MNTKFKVKLTPKDDRAVYSRNLTMLSHLKKGLFVELAPMQVVEVGADHVGGGGLEDPMY